MTVREVAGTQLEFDEEGFMSNPDDWNNDIGQTLALDIGIDPLTERHWKVIDFCRADYAAKGEAPGLRRISQQAEVPTKELYKLFPKGPAKKVAYVSGLGKPTGCI
jgi:TusE/DsrC/DsvC family sulfur relay protein